MPGLIWMLGGLAGGAAGALIWIVVGYFTGYEVGWIAWGVGLLVGAGLRYAAWKSDVEESMVQGVAAGAIAILSIVAAKYTVAYLQIEQAREEVLATIGGDAPTEEDMIMSAAYDVVGERIEAGEPVRWPAGVSADTAGKEDFPKDVWAEGERRWRSFSPAEQNERKQALVDFQRQMVNAIARDLTVSFEDLFTPWDLLWAFLAVGTAYKIGAGSLTSDE